MLRNPDKKLFISRTLASIMPGGAASYRAEVLKDAPLLYVRFEEISGTAFANIGSLGSSANLDAGTDIVGQPGGIGRALVMDGTSVVTFPFNAGLQLTGDATYELWVRTAAPNTFGDGFQTLMDAGFDGGSAGGYLIRTNGSPKLEILKSNVAVLGTSSGLVPQDGLIHHIAFTRSGNLYSFYIDGAFDSSFTSATTIVASTQPFGIGCHTVTGGSRDEKVAGLIDEVAVYGSALSAARMSAHYQAGITERRSLATAYGFSASSFAGTLLGTGPCLYYRLDESSGTFQNYGIIDGVGTAHGTITRSVATGLTGAGDGITFGGTTSDFITAQANEYLNFKDNISFACWVKVTSFANYNGIFTKGATGGNGYEFRIDQTTRTLTLLKANVAGWTSSGTVPNDGAWHWIVVTVTGNTVSFYIDGAAAGTATRGAAPTHTTDLFTIGLSNGPAFPFQGSMDEVAYWENALTGTQISAIYAARNTA